MSETWNVAVVGATGTVGETVVEVLGERGFPVAELHLLAEAGALGRRMQCGSRRVEVKDLAQFDFTGSDVAIFCGDASEAERYAAVAVAAGCSVVDCSARFRSDPQVPLVVPEINPHALDGFSGPGIVAVPSSSAVQLACVLGPLLELGVESVDAACLQAVSDLGRAGIDALAMETANLLNARPLESGAFGAQIAFNVLRDNGAAEREVTVELSRVLDLGTQAISLSLVRVPVFFGHSQTLHVRTSTPLDGSQVRELLAQFEYLSTDVADPSAVGDGANSDAIIVGEVRVSDDGGLRLWSVADNVRRGVAISSVKIAEILVRNGL